MAQAPGSPPPPGRRTKTKVVPTILGKVVSPLPGATMKPNQDPSRGENPRPKIREEGAIIEVQGRRGKYPAPHPKDEPEGK